MSTRYPPSTSTALLMPLLALIPALGDMSPDEMNAWRRLLYVVLGRGPTRPQAQDARREQVERRTLERMAHPPVPPGLRILRTDEITGTDSRGRKAPKIANLPRVTPSAPDWIRSDPNAHAEWRRVTPVLGRVRLMHDASRAALAAYCAAWSRFVRAHRGYMSGEDVSYREVTEHDRSLRAWAGHRSATESCLKKDRLSGSRMQARPGESGVRVAGRPTPQVGGVFLPDVRGGSPRCRGSDPPRLTPTRSCPRRINVRFAS